MDSEIQISYLTVNLKDNVMFIGDASGGAGNIYGMIQGQFAGSVAASAIKDKDVTKQRLNEYQDSVCNTLGKVPFSWLSAREYYGTFNDWFHTSYTATMTMAIILSVTLNIATPYDRNITTHSNS